MELTTAVILLMTSFYSGPAISTDTVVSAEPLVNKVDTIKEITLTKGEILARAKVIFKEDPILLDIAFCESSLRHYNTDGEVLRGKVNSADMGLMQINTKYHAEKASELGFDLETPEGNMQYAKWLYDKEGGQPWISSSKCWNQAITLEKTKVLAVNK
ncbi:MAG: hypothetical protein WCC74_03245 [Minisyncoccia bacterium]